MRGFVVVALLLATLVSCGDARHLAGVRILIRPGEDAVAVVAASAPGTTFVFERGVHRLAEAITPRPGDAFVGEDGAVLNGSRLLTSFESQDGLYVVEGQTQQGGRSGTCEVGFPRCDHPEDLFIDDVPLQHVDALDKVVPGTWFFDYEADTIYFADDPSGKKVETSVAPAAISGSADDVTIRGLTIEKFATPVRPGGAINTRVMSDPNVFGERWLIENNTVRFSHAVGINAGHGARIVGNTVVWNGQLGLGGGWGNDTVVEGNEIANNNWAGFQWSWEGGGAKWSRSRGLTIRDNHVHHNEGPGLWTDIDNIDTLIEGNDVHDNARVGIFHEISYRATIRHNSVRDNGVDAGMDAYAFVYGAGILVSSSSDVTVHGNLVEGNWDGIVALQGPRGDGEHGPYEVRNLEVRDNVVQMGFHVDGIGPRGQVGIEAATGVVRNGGQERVWTDAYNNRFERNHYVVAEPSGLHFRWRDSRIDFMRWQQYGQDPRGVLAGPSRDANEPESGDPHEPDAQPGGAVCKGC